MTEAELTQQQKAGQVKVVEATQVPDLSVPVQINPSLEEYIPILDKLRNGGLSLFQAGMVLPYTSATDPVGWYVCDGRAVSREADADLFAIIGTDFGAGDGSTTFNLPNAQGKVWVGYASDIPPFNTIGLTGGEISHTLTLSEMPAHYHTWSTRNAGEGVEEFLNTLQTTGATDTGNFIHGNRTNTQGSGAAHNNLQPYIVGTYIIKR